MDPSQNYLLLPLWYVVFLLSLTCHEAAHAFTSFRGGDDTALLAGQATLNPLAHIRREPIGTILVPLGTIFQLGYMMGWASAPYDLRWGDRHPRRAALMAAAGPLANLTLALAAFVALRLGLATGAWSLTPVHLFRIDQIVVAASGGTSWLEGLGRLLSILLVLNVALFLFNLIPLPPMDGASVLAGFFGPARRLREHLGASPFASLAGLLVAWTLFPRLYGPVIGWILTRL